MEPKQQPPQEPTEFITVVAVGSETPTPPSPATTPTVNYEKPPPEKPPSPSPYVTVLTIGEDDQIPDEVIEEVLVYRLPGERLGFGLKFEGGTKASEFVKRLFIQSCAPDSPASRVRCSWDKLTEGDEVLEIDSTPVKNMTRIDCVRCLKDSNVVIKLLIKHTSRSSIALSKEIEAKLAEDLPQIVSAEKKRVPPPPPPVPPRKIPRKLYRDNGSNVSAKTNGVKAPAENCPPVPPVRHTISDQNGNTTKINRFQSPRNSGRFAHTRNGHEEPCSRDRKISDSSIGPPDPEVYTDLFSQESTCSLSESDDTGSSISTVVDRLSARSLPTTPTAMQRHLDLTQLNPYDIDDDVDFDTSEDYLAKLASKYDSTENGICDTDKVQTSQVEGSPLQPPSCFQDAPLSYGNEVVKVLEKSEEICSEEDLRVNGFCEENVKVIQNGCIETEFCDKRPPPPPPRTKNLSLTSPEKNKPDAPTIANADNSECDEATDLPRLVDFVPKLHKGGPIEIMKTFLEHEKRISSDTSEKCWRDERMEKEKEEFWNDGVDYYNFNWNSSSQLATIGEDEEEGSTEFSFQRPQNAPIVIVENADCEKTETETKNEPAGDSKAAGADPATDKDEIHESSIETDANNSITTQIVETDGNMEAPPSYSRQPPDGHEFPDYQEPQTVTKAHSHTMPRADVPQSKGKKLWDTASSYFAKDYQSSRSVRDKIAIFSSHSKDAGQAKIYKSSEDVFNGAEEEPFDNLNKSKSISKSVMSLNSIKSSLNETSSSALPSKVPSSECKVANKISSLEIPRPNKDVNIVLKAEESRDAVTPTTRLHTRSQSLIDVSSISESRSSGDRWSMLMEQRKRGLSKLKGLVIPEHAPEPGNAAHPVVDIPEIKTKSTAVISPVTDLKMPTPEPIGVTHSRNVSTPCISMTSWNSKTNSIPKYSPAFKRKGLQIYGSTSFNKGEDKPAIQRRSLQTGICGESTAPPKPELNFLTEKTFVVKTPPKMTEDEDCRCPGSLSLDQAPKSLESITSPTRSDCSFEYISSSPEPKHVNCQERGGQQRPVSQRGKEDIGRSEDESDNDSAVSSSQSSYISRSSPPASPNHLHFSSRTCNMLEADTSDRQRRTGSQQELQVTASAKCRSGRDLKAGSPLIQRKFDKDADGLSENHAIITDNGDASIVNEPEIPAKHSPPALHPLCLSSPTEEKSTTPPLHISNSTSVPSPQIIPTKFKQVETNTKSIITSKENIYSPPVRSIQTPPPKAADLRCKGLNLPTPKCLSNNVRSASVNDLKKSFEKLAPQPVPKEIIKPVLIPTTKRKSLETSEVKSPKVNNIRSSSEKIVLKKEVQEIISSTVKDLDESIPSENVKVVILKPEILGGSVGITLAGGTDYETKEISIHKVRDGSVAYRDGQLKKGDRILSINGRGMKGLTHAESVAILKERIPEVTIVACSSTKTSTTESVPNSPRRSSQSLPLQTVVKEKDKVISTNKAETILIVKDAAGLGFSVEGGHDSPSGDVPLTVKKIFKGGAAEKCGQLQPGDKLLAINGVDVTSMSRIDAWALMKKLPEGNITLSVQR